jgi:hypothetical protein
MAKTKSFYLMKTIMYKASGLLLAAALITACSKDSAPAKTKTEFITQASWKFESEGIDLDKNGTIEAPSGEVEDCNKDDVFTFVSGGTGTRDEGATKCDGADPQINPFVWQFKSNETEIEFDGHLFKLHTLNDNSLKGYKDIDTMGISVRIWATFKH